MLNPVRSRKPISYVPLLYRSLRWTLSASPGKLDDNDGGDANNKNKSDKRFKGNWPICAADESMAASLRSSGVVVGGPDMGDGGAGSGQGEIQRQNGCIANSICFSAAQISLFLVRVGMPYNIIWQPEHLVSCPFCHFGKTFRLRLVFECVTRKVDPYVVDDEYQSERPVMACQRIPDLCTSAFTSIFTPPIPSNATSSSLFLRQSPIAKRYSRPVSYSLYPVRF